VNAHIDVTPQERSIVEAILQKGLPPGSQVWASGSRTHGIVHRGSDLDLAIDAGRDVSADEMTLLKYEFEVSLLSFTVDIIDIRTMRGVFAQNVLQERVFLMVTTDLSNGT